jgi:hypothetical protein
VGGRTWVGLSPFESWTPSAKNLRSRPYNDYNPSLKCGRRTDRRKSAPVFVTTSDFSEPRYFELSCDASNPMTTGRKRIKYRWLLLLATVAGFALLVEATPCGCFGLTFWRPDVRPVEQLPDTCQIVTTPTVWRDNQGEAFETFWEAILQDSMLPPGGDETRTHYELRDSPEGLLVGLAVPGASRKSQNEFRLRGIALTEASPNASNTALPLPYENPHQVSVSLRSSGAAHYVGGGTHADERFVAIHSHSGPEMFPDFPTYQRFTPWIVRGTGFVDFYDLASARPLGPPLVYSFCGRESWMRSAAAWHASRFYTMPLRLDGRTFILCEPARMTQRH